MAEFLCDLVGGLLHEYVGRERSTSSVERGSVKLAQYSGLLAIAALVFVAPAHGRFDLDVQKSKVLTGGRSHIDAVSAFVTYTDEFFGGRTNALAIQMYAAPIDAAARARLLKDHKDDRELSRSGSVYLVLFVDKQNRITQVNLTYIIPGTTVVRTVAYTPSDIAQSFSDYRYADGRLHLKCKGTYVTGAESTDEQLTLAWDVELDEAVVNRVSAKKGG
jgi:hypothetical protein